MKSVKQRRNFNGREFDEKKVTGRAGEHRPVVILSKLILSKKTNKTEHLLFMEILKQLVIKIIAILLVNVDFWTIKNTEPPDHL